jgi:hypothetical protein
MNDLHDAITAGDIDRARELIAKDNQIVNQRHTETRESPALLAAKLAKGEILALLLDKGASFHPVTDQAQPLSVKVASLEKAVEATEALPDRNIRYIALSKAYEEMALAYSLPPHKQIANMIKFYQLAITQIEYLKGNGAPYYMKLYSLNLACATLLHNETRHADAVKYFEDALSYVGPLLKEIQDSDVNTKIRLDAANCLSLCGISYYYLGDLDTHDQKHQDALNLLFNIELPQRNSAYYSAISNMFTSWLDQYSLQDRENQFYQFASLAFKNDDPVINLYVNLIGKLTSQRESPQYRHLLTPMMQIMWTILAGYTKEDFPNAEIKEYLANEENKKRFTAQLERLKQMRVSPLLQITASNPSFLRGMHTEYVKLKTENKELRKEVAELKEQVARMTGPDPKLFSQGGQKRTLDEGKPPRDDTEPPEKRLKKDK